MQLDTTICCVLYWNAVICSFNNINLNVMMILLLILKCSWVVVFSLVSTHIVLLTWKSWRRSLRKWRNKYVNLWVIGWILENPVVLLYDVITLYYVIVIYLDDEFCKVLGVMASWRGSCRLLLFEYLDPVEVRFTVSKENELAWLASSRLSSISAYDSKSNREWSSLR